MGAAAATNIKMICSKNTLPIKANGIVSLKSVISKYWLIASFTVIKILIYKIKVGHNKTRRCHFQKIFIPLNFKNRSFQVIVDCFFHV